MKFTRLLMGICALLASCAETSSSVPTTPAATPAAPASAEAPPLLELPNDVRPVHYALAMKIAPEAEGYSGSVDIDLELTRPRSIIWLHGRDLRVSAVSIGGVHGAYEQFNDDGLARVQLEKAIEPGKATLHMEFEGKWSPQLAGLYRVHEAGVPYVFSMFEPVDARRAFPCFDQPLFKTPFDVSLTVPKSDVAIGNTLTKDERIEGDWKIIRFQPTVPLPVYLMAWAVGPLDVLEGPPIPPNEIRKRPLPQRGVAPKGRGKELALALKDGAAIVTWLERYYGIEYPFDKLDHVAVPDFAYGAEEHAGEIHYREEDVLYDETKAGVDEQANVVWTIAHETSHQWFGDLVTMPWWTDIWLNEGFASFMAPQVVEGVAPELQPLNEMGGLHNALATASLGNARAIRQPLVRMGDILAQLDGITYQGGKATLEMFQKFVGKEPYRLAIHDYLAAHAFGTGDTDDLIARFSKAAGRDLAPAFHSFLDQSGIPLIQATTICAPGKNGPATIELKQSRFLPLGSTADKTRLWIVPVCVRAPDGDHCTLLEKAAGSIALDKCPAWIVPSADGTGFYRWTLPPAELERLADAPLTVRERLSLIANVLASIDSGALSWPDGFRVLKPLAHSDDPSVAWRPLTFLLNARDNYVSDALRPQVERTIRELYGPVAQQLGWQAATADSLHRRELRVFALDTLALYAGEPEVRREALKRGNALLKLPEFDRTAASPDLIATALAVAVREGGAPVFDSLVARLGTMEDSNDRARLIEALSEASDPALAARARDLVFDKRVRSNERVDFLAWQFAHRDQRDAAWTWVKANYDRLLPIIPELHSGHLVRLVANFCDEEHAKDISAFLTPRAAKIGGGPRELAQALERIELCATQKKAHGAEIDAFFSK